MRRFLVQVTVVAISASAVLIGSAPSAAADHGSRPIVIGVTPVVVDGKPAFQDFNFTGLIPPTRASDYRDPEPVIALPPKVAELTYKLKDVLVSSVVPTPGGSTGGVPLSRPIVGVVPDPAPLLLPAVQKVREAASRATGGIPLQQPVVGVIPDPAPLLLPAVQKVREAASRATRGVPLTRPIVGSILDPIR